MAEAAEGGLIPLGSQMPALSVPGTGGSQVTREGLCGVPTLLVFLPLAFSPVCSGEVASLTARLDDLAGARVLGVTCDSVATLRAWAERERVGFELLSDFWPHGAMTRAFGAFDEEAGHPRRVSVLTDGDGTVTWTVQSPAGLPRSVEEHVQAVAGLSGRQGR